MNDERDGAGQAPWRRLASGLGVLALTGGAVVAAAAVQEPTWTPVTGAQVELPLGDAVVVCPAEPRLLDADGLPETDEDFDARADTTTGLRAVAVGPEQPSLTLTTADGEQVEGVAAGALALAELTDERPAGHVVARAAPGAEQPVGLAAVQTSITGAGDLRGLAASGCAEPVEDAWVVAGSTVVGRSSRLDLVNPGPTAATVDLTVVTADGLTQPAAGQGITLAAGEHEDLLVEGLAPGAEALAVRVEASGGRVAAALVDSRLQGLTPQGVDTTVAQTYPSGHHVLPGVLPRAAAPPPQLVVAVPGDEDAVVRWQVLGPDGPVALDGATATTVAARTTADIDITGLGQHEYTVVVDSDVPVVAAVRSAINGTGEPSDIAWASAARPLTGRSVVALPTAATVRLLLTAVGQDAQVQVQAVGADGAVTATEQVAVGAGTARVAYLAAAGDDAAAALVLDVPPDGEVVAGLVLTAVAEDTGQLASVVPVRPESQPPGGVSVRTLPGSRWP